jgi:prepilin-type N-terminal cleavage/methylation domain-containing protein
MKKQRGFTLTELMAVVAIVAVLSAIAIPMYADNVRKSKVQEAVDTIGAIKDEIGGYVSDNGYLPPTCNNHNRIRTTLGVQVPENGKWRYRVRNNGRIDARALVPLGRSLSGGWVRCIPTFDGGNRVITSWWWRCDGQRVKSSYLPK